MKNMFLETTRQKVIGCVLKIVHIYVVFMNVKYTTTSNNNIL